MKNLSALLWAALMLSFSSAAQATPILDLPPVPEPGTLMPLGATRLLISRLIPRTLRCFVTLSEPLFIQAPRFTR